MRDRRRMLAAMVTGIGIIMMSGCANSDFAADTSSLPEKTESTETAGSTTPQPTAAPAQLNPLEGEYGNGDSTESSVGSSGTARMTGITNSGVNVRVSPKGEAIDSIPDNVEVEILSREGGWFQIRYENIEGYIYGQFIDIDGVNGLDLED